MTHVQFIASVPEDNEFADFRYLNGFENEIQFFLDSIDLLMIGIY